MIARTRLIGDDKEPRQTEWRKLVKEVKNNQPEIVNEWTSATINEQKRYFRDAFGPYGLQLRLAGFGALTIGSLTQAAIERFAVKLGKALY